MWRASITARRDVAQLGRALGSGPRGRGFKSRHPDHPAYSGRPLRRSAAFASRCGVLAEVLRFIGFGLCHQLPERSFSGGGVQVPVCARDTGIYIGFVVALVVIAVLHRGRRPARFPSVAGWVVVAVLFGSMVVDGVTSYAGLRQTDNLLRLITGTAAGFAIAAVLVPMLNSELWRRSDRDRVLDPPWKLAVWTAFVPLTVLAIWFLAPALGIGYPLLVTVAIFVTFTTANMIFAAILPPFDRAAERLRDLAGPIAFGFGLTVLELVGAALLRVAFDAFLSRLT